MHRQPRRFQPKNVAKSAAACYACRMRHAVASPNPPAQTLTLQRSPAWARPPANPANIGLSEAAFVAGAALANLDRIVRLDPPWAGTWRYRLALKAAANTGHGVASNETILRDALLLTRPGDSLGPAGQMLLAWRSLTEPAPLTAKRIAATAEQFGVPIGQGDSFAELLLLNQSRQPAVFAAAAVGMATVTQKSGAQKLALWLADAVLAKYLNWPAPVPLLATEISKIPLLTNGTPSQADAWAATCCLAYASAATKACDLAADLERRATKLQDSRRVLRAKGADNVIDALLADDCLTTSTKVSGITERGLRRLFDRLVDLGAVREFSGRLTFRLYGL